VLLGGTADADNNPNGMVFRAVGWFKGKAEITAGQIKCEIPSVTSAISEGAFSLGLWNTYGFPTLMYPDINSPFGNPCGVWIQLQSNLINQGLVVDRIQLRYRIQGGRRFLMAGVPMRKRWPTACQDFRKAVVYVGARLNPSNSSVDSSGSGAPNVAFIEMLPLVSPQQISCLRSQFAPLPPDVFSSLTVVASAKAIAASDAGDSYASNVTSYTLTLRHSCGNGRVDDGEDCDPAAANTCAGTCRGGVCSQSDSLGCVTDADCAGTCTAVGDPSECVCVY
jgi:hypothetical protein